MDTILKFQMGMWILWHVAEKISKNFKNKHHCMKKKKKIIAIVSERKHETCFFISKSKYVRMRKENKNWNVKNQGKWHILMN